jgi:hypothetical protein
VLVGTTVAGNETEKKEKEKEKKKTAFFFFFFLDGKMGIKKTVFSSFWRAKKIKIIIIIIIIIKFKKKKKKSDRTPAHRPSSKTKQTARRHYGSWRWPLFVFIFLLIFSKLHF